MNLDPDEHLSAFVTAFVVAAKKDRWRHLLARPRHRIRRNRESLPHDLDERFCARVACVSDLDPARAGVFWPLWDEPTVATAADVLARDHCTDAVFSLAPGRSAVVFTHDNERWVCRR